jgi:HK97 family phage portal protein
MALLEYFLGPRRAAANDIPWTDDLDSFGGRSWGGRRRTQAGPVVDEDLALTYSALWCGTRVIAETGAMLPLLTYQRTDDDDHKEFPGHQLYPLLKTAPNPEMGSMAFREGRMAHQVLWGNAFAEIERDSDGAPVALWPIHPARVQPVRRNELGANGRPLYPDYPYKVRNDDGTWLAMKADELLHVPGVLNEDGMWGKSVVAYGRESIGMGLGVQRHGASTFGAGGVPRGVITKSGMQFRDPEQRRQFRQEWKEMHGSPDSGEVAILQGEAEYKLITMSNEDFQFLGTLRFNVSEIARWLRLPPHLLMDLERSTNNNIEQQGMEFVIYGEMPWLCRWEEQLSLKLLRPEERGAVFFEHQLDRLLRGDVTARFNAYRVALASGFMTINQVCRLERLPSIGPAGDVNYVPVNMTTAQAMLESPPLPGSGAGPGSDKTGAPAFGGGDPRAAFDAWARQRFTKAARKELVAAFAALEGAAKHNVGDVRNGHARQLYSDDQPRAEDGMWTDGGGSGDSSGGTDERSGGKEFSGKAEADRWGQDHFNNWSAEATDDEYNAADTYAGGEYAAINNGLRRNGGRPAKADAKTVRDLDSLLDKGEVREGVVAWRGIDRGANLSPGDVIHDHGYVSTSLYRGTAEKFADKALLRINVPKGSKAGYLDALTEGGGEQELLLPRGSRFRVTGVRREGGAKVIDAELLPHAHPAERGRAARASAHRVPRTVLASAEPATPPTSRFRWEPGQYTITPGKGRNGSVDARGNAPRRNESAFPQRSGGHGTTPQALDTPDIRQREAWDCGPAATKTVCDFLGAGLETYEDYVVQLGTTPEDGTSVPAIIGLLAKQGLPTASGAGLSIEDLAEHVANGRPVLCPVQAYGTPAQEAADRSGHYVVVRGVLPDLSAVLVQDPSAGRKSVPRAEWEESWHDRDADGTVYERYGIAAGPAANGRPAVLAGATNGRAAKRPSRYACGGPGSGVPGPCPENKTEEPKEDKKGSEISPPSGPSPHDFSRPEGVKKALDENARARAVVAKLAELHAQTEAARAAEKSADAKSREAFAAWDKAPKGAGEKMSAYLKASKEHKEASDRLKGLEDSQRQTLLEHAAAPNPAKVNTSATGSERTRGAADEASAFVGKLLAGEHVGGKVDVPVRERAEGEPQRAGYSDGTVHATKYADARQVVHEMGHALEDKIPGVGAAAFAFLEHRVGGEKPTPMNEVPGFKGAYASHEMGRKDAFDKTFDDLGTAYYAGKDYGDRGTEMLSLGLEELHKNPGKFAAKDPEYANFVLSCLDGTFHRDVETRPPANPPGGKKWWQIW